MSPVYEIASDERVMTIAVGRQLFTRPDLNRRPEIFDDIKQKVCGRTPWEDGIKAVYQFWCRQIGPQFNRRFQAANYWLWVGNRMSERTGNMLRHDGKNWHRYDNALVWRANQVLPYVREAERDGLYHLIPAIVIFGESPQAIRKRVGQGAWRRIANNSITRNGKIMRTVARMTPDGNFDPMRFVRLLNFPSGVLSGIRAADEDEQIAARITRLKQPIEFRHTVDLIRDTRRMLGKDFNSAWQYQRMSREHDAAVREMMNRRYSDKRFAPDWSFADGGFRATLLTSKLEIATEGGTQRHCAASYAHHAAHGRYALFRIEGIERATAGIVPETGKLDQVYGVCNSQVSDACRQFAFALAREYQHAIGKVAA